MSEQINHFGLANLLGFSSQRLRDKILFQKKLELQQLGPVVDDPNGIVLNTDQVLFLAMSSTNVDYIKKIQIIKAVFGYIGEKENIEIKPNSNFDSFAQRCEKL